jgi:hypothetical protein
VTKLYAGSDGRYYTEWQVSWRFENDEWRPCMWDSDDGWELVEEDDELVWLYPADLEGVKDLPEWAELRQRGHGVAVVDLREEAEHDHERPEPRVEGSTG